MEIKEVIKEVKESLYSVGIEDISETEWLIAETLGVRRNAIYMLQNISQKDYLKIQRVLKQRMRRIPLDYIIGRSEFYGLSLKVDNNVLIPRPETEILVEHVLNVVNDNDKVLDIGTGSGAIAIAISKNAKVKMIAVDISKGALTVAKENAKEHNVNVEFIESDLFSNLKDEKYDIIISNPPYIPTKDISSLDIEVKDNEPLSALDGGSSGFVFYEQIIDKLDKYLKVNGYLFLEVGINQAQTIAEMLKNNYDVEIIKDYNGIERIIKARRIVWLKSWKI